jgi:hypothetical protein
LHVRFTLSTRRAKGRIAKDRFALDQTMQRHDCEKTCKDGDFIVQKRDFFGNYIDELTIAEVKTGNSLVSKAQKKRKRQFGRNRYKVVRYYISQRLFFEKRFCFLFRLIELNGLVGCLVVFWIMVRYGDIAKFF